MKALLDRLFKAAPVTAWARFRGTGLRLLRPEPTPLLGSAELVLALKRGFQ